MRTTGPINDDRKTCDLRIKSDGATFVCIKDRHAGSETHKFSRVGAS